MSELTDTELGVLKLANSYGVDLDLSAPRISRTIKAAGRELLRKGYLTGTMKAVSLTVRGAGALPEWRSPVTLKDIAFRRVKLSELENLEAQIVELRQVLSAYEQWEADLIMENKCWSGQNCQFTDELWDRMIEIQGLRNKALGRF